MFDLKQPKHQLALAALVLLVSLKFIVVPLIDWQNTQLAQLTNLEKRAAKSQNVIANQGQISQSQQSINAQLEAINELFVNYQREGEFKLAMQQQLEQTVASNQLQINTSSWLPSIAVANNQLIRHQLRLNLKGKMRDFITLITHLESQTPKAELKSLNINIKGQKTDALGNMSGSLELAFYMHQAPNTAEAQ